MRVLTIATITIVALLGGLWLLIDDGDHPVATAAPREREAENVMKSESSPVAKPPVNHAPSPPVVLERPMRAADPESPAPTTAPTVTDDAAVKPPTIEDALNEQLLVTESLLLECNDKALKAGKMLDGEAAFAFTVARKNGTIVIESTGVEYAPYGAAASDCLRETAHAMVFDSLPDGVEAMTAYRKVVFENGSLRRQWMTAFAVTRPPPPVH
ncbi:MAG: hypothetical protein H0T42_32835 [Deltaproteobacteria bacterium]|nr:hypothetical protein [Deltaproteobacteria bacterium]